MKNRCCGRCGELVFCGGLGRRKPLIHAGVDMLFTQSRRFAQADVSPLWEAWERRGECLKRKQVFPILQSSTTGI
jgi:hypothetical protein